MVATCTISPKVKKKIYVLPIQGTYVFLCISEQTVIMSVHNIN